MKTETKTKCSILPAEGKKMNVMGHEATVKLHSADANDNYVFEVISPVGFGIPPHVHKNEDEVIYIQSGEFEIFFGGEVFTATAGTYLNFVRGIPHGFKNIGSAPGKTLWHVNPGESFEEFFDKLGSLPAGPPDLEYVAQLFADYGMTILPPQN